MKNLITSIILLVTPLMVVAQSKGAMDWKDRKNLKIDSLEYAVETINRLSFQAEYMSKVVFVGRDYNIKQFGVPVTLAYHHRSGLNLSYTGNYWSGLPNPYALTDVGIYFDKNVYPKGRRSFDPVFNFSAGYWRLFFHNGSSEERKLYTNLLALDLNHFGQLASLGAAFYYVSGSEKAYQVDLRIFKPIEIYRVLGADKLTFEPTFTTMISTISYIPFFDETTVVLGEVNVFKVANYELTLPWLYRKFKKYEVGISWHYNWPVNVTPDEDLRPFSYFTFGFVKIFAN
jgi:hypothetical protein